MEFTFTDANLAEEIKKGKPMVVDFWAVWCGPCRLVSPIIEELAGEYAGKVTIGKLNVDENSEAPAMYSVRNIPTILFFKDGQLVDRKVGAQSKETLKKAIDALL